MATVTVRLSDEPERPIDIPFTATGATGAAASDYTVPRSVTFAADDIGQTFTVTAVDDAVDDDDETVTLTLSSLLPAGVSAGSPATATVTLTDNDTVTGAPSVLSVTLTSDPGGVYAAGKEIEVTVRFDKTATVTGTPQLGLTVGSTVRQALYQGGAREVVTFSYEVAADETDADGVSIAANALSLNGGTIRDSANQNAVLTHSALAADENHRVDGVTPMLQMAVVDETILTLTYDEPLAPAGAPCLIVFQRGDYPPREWQKCSKSGGGWIGHDGDAVGSSIGGRGGDGALLKCFDFWQAAPHPGSRGQPSGKLEKPRSDECDGGAAL